MFIKKSLILIFVYISIGLRSVISAYRRVKYKGMYNISIGSATIIEKGVWIRPFANLKIDSKCYIGKDVSIDVGSDLQRCQGLTIGDKTWISQNCLLQSSGKVSIGSNVLIGEFTSIRDTTHSYSDYDKPIKDQSSVVGELIIEDNVWIGRGCLILGQPDGISIGTGSIIGANSVVTNSIPQNSVWGGVPARFIKLIEGSGSNNPTHINNSYGTDTRD